MARGVIPASLSAAELAALEDRIRRLRAWASRAAPLHAAGGVSGDPVGGGDPVSRSGSIKAAHARAVAMLRVSGVEALEAAGAAVGGYRQGGRGSLGRGGR